MTLEQLLNKLIDKGWKPMGWDAQKYKISFSRRKITIQLYHETHPKQEWIERSLRELVSKESGLWQFVCENGMVDNSNFYTREKVDEERDWIDVTYSTIVEGKKGGHYRYRLIEAALKDESELEEFLLQNIKIDE